MKPPVNVAEKAELLRDFFVKEKRMPGYGEMLRLFKYKSKSGVHVLLGLMADAGYIRKEGRKISMTGRTVFGGIPWLGSVVAGFPSPAEEELVELMNLDEYLIEKRGATFMVSVNGDSMIEAGIMPKDLVLVERGRKEKTNDIVVAQVDGEWTIKYFISDKDGVRLEPANKNYPTIWPKQSIVIAGVVRAVVRKYL